MNARASQDLVTLLTDRAESAPDRLAYLYLGDTQGPISLTSEQLRVKAWAIAARLRDGRPRGERVLLLFPPGLEFMQAFMGCACAGAIAVPAPPPNPLKPHRSLERLATIVDSARPTWVLTISSVLEALKPALADMPTFASIEWLCIDAMGDGSIDDWAPEPASPDDVALIQYTSGSTSNPKGAALSHGNVLHNVNYLDADWKHDERSVQVNWLPAFHDLGLVYGILAPLQGGFLGVQMSPIDVIQRPLVWLQAITRYRATHSSGPNFIYELCVRKVSDAQRLTLDLSSWRMALTAAEPVRADTMQRFVDRFKVAGFRPRTFCPGYGLSEGTCKVTAVACDADPIILTVESGALERHRVELAPPHKGSQRVVGCGKPGMGVDVHIVHPETRTILPPHRIGEIWVAGPNVAHSYWQNATATEDLLQAKTSEDDNTPHLRTGDLGFLHKGNLFITGRIKDIIIVRGTNHYPQDIEYSVEDAHPSIRAGCTAAFAFETEGEEHVGIVCEVERRKADAWTPSVERRSADPDPNLPPAPSGFSADDVVAAITRAVAEHHGLRVHQVVLIKAGTIPKTTSGKIRRQATRQAMLMDRLTEVETTTQEDATTVDSGRADIRSSVFEIVSEIGGIPLDRLDANESLHTFGIDSLAGVNIAYEIGLLVGKDVPQTLVSDKDTIEKLVDYVISMGGSQ